MATQLQLRRGTAAENAVFTGAEGELTMSTDTKTMHIHDGSTTGGFMVDTVVAFQKPTAGNDYTWVRKYASGWVEQGGYVSATSSSITKDITLPVEMSDGNYQVSKTIHGGAGSNNGLGWDGIGDKSSVASANTSTKLYLSVPNTNFIIGVWWEVKGIAA